MYIPPHFHEDSTPALNRAMAEAGLVTIVSASSGEPAISHVPVHFDPTAGTRGSISWHLSRANAHCEVLRAGASTIAIFMGPDAYISPVWYEEKAKTGRVVPTWNYLAVHASGPVSTFDDGPQLLALVEALTDTHEADRPAPWAVSDAPDDFVAAQLKGIVGFSMEITALEGKRKASQNKPAGDRVRMARGLAAETRQAAQDMGAIITDRN